MHSPEICFDVVNWRAVSDRLSSAEEWRQWAVQPEMVASWPQKAPDVSFLPALQRRRLSAAARLLFAAAWPLLPSDSACPTVFASYDGEINRSFELWQMLLRDHQVSPTSFGLSVHNALIGQWSMLRHDMSETTALCVSTDGFETAFVEAAALLAEGHEQVLVLVADDPLLPEYTIPQVLRAPFAYAFAAVVRAGKQCSVQLRSSAATSAAAPLNYDGALNWLKHVSLAEAGQVLSFDQQYDHRVWHWRYQQ